MNGRLGHLGLTSLGAWSQRNDGDIFGRNLNLKLHPQTPKQCWSCRCQSCQMQSDKRGKITDPNVPSYNFYAYLGLGSM